MLNPLLNQFYSKHRKICFYTNNKVECIKDISYLVNEINKNKNYKKTSVTKILNQLKNIDLQRNIINLVKDIKKNHRKISLDILIKNYFIDDKFNFNFKVLNQKEIDNYKLYYEVLKILNISIKYKKFILILQNQKFIKQNSIKKLIPIKKFNIKEVDALNGHDFETFCAFLFRKLNYKVTQTQASNDYGADLVISKNRVIYSVQCKRYSKNLDNTAIQEVVASMSFYKATKSIVITNSKFTKSAINLAKVNNVILIDRDALVSLMSKINIK